MTNEARLADMARLIKDASTELNRLLGSVGLMESLTAASGAIIASTFFVAEQRGPEAAILALQGQIGLLEELRPQQVMHLAGAWH